MKASKTTLIATLALGSLLALSPALRAADTNTPPATPPASNPPPAGPRGPGGGPTFTEHMAGQLGLSDEQKPKFQSIMDGQMQKIRELRQDPNFRTLSPEERNAKMEAVNKDTETQMKALLTPEQFDKWQKMPHPGMRGRRPGPPPSGENAGSTNAPAAKPANPPQK